VVCVIVALDRQEVTDPAVPFSAIELLAQENGVQVASVIGLNHLIEFVRTQEVRRPARREWMTCRR
jgi:orotate phosphoribosyltransferase